MKRRTMVKLTKKERRRRRALSARAKSQHRANGGFARRPTPTASGGGEIGPRSETLSLGPASGSASLSVAQSDPSAKDGALA